LHNIFIYIRNNISSEIIIILLKLILHKIQSPYEESDYGQIILCKKVDVYDFIKEFLELNQFTCKEIILNYILGYALTRVIKLLEKSEYDEAYDLIDSVHILPEIIYNLSKRKLKDYWEDYIVVYHNKWNNKYFDDKKDIIFSLVKM